MVLPTDSLKNQINSQTESGPLAARPLPSKVPANDYYFATDTGELFILVRRDGVAPFWQSILTGAGGESGVIIYANPTTGNDSNDGLSAATAVRTFPAAVGRVPVFRGLAEILLAAGTYDDIGGGTYVAGSPETGNAPNGFGLNVIGTLGLSAGPFTTTADSDPFGTVIPLGGAPAIDAFLGGVMFVVSSPDPSLVGSSPLIGQNDGAGNTTPVQPFFTTVPAGTVISILRPVSVLPYSSGFLLVGPWSFSATKFHRTTAGNAHVDCIPNGSQIFVGNGSEIDYGAATGSASWRAILGTIAMGSSSVDVEFNQVPLALFATGTYLHRAGYNGALLASRSPGAQQGNVSLDSCVVTNGILNTFASGVMALSSVYGVNLYMEVDDGSHMDLVDVFTRGYVAGGPSFVASAFDGCSITVFDAQFDGFLNDGVLLDSTSNISIGDGGLGIGLGGTSAGGAGYGLHLADGSESNCFIPCSIHGGGAGGGDIVMDNGGHGLVTHTWVALTGVGFFNDVPSGCRIVLIV